MERKGNEEIGEKCGSGRIGERIPSPADFINARTFLLLFGEQKVRHGVPEGGQKSQDKSGCKAGESEIGSPAPHLFRFEIEDDVHAGELKVQAHLLHCRELQGSHGSYGCPALL